MCAPSIHYAYICLSGVYPHSVQSVPTLHHLILSPNHVIVYSVVHPMYIYLYSSPTLSPSSSSPIVVYSFVSLHRRRPATTRPFPSRVDSWPYPLHVACCCNTQCNVICYGATSWCNGDVFLFFTTLRAASPGVCLLDLTHHRHSAM